MIDRDIQYTQGTTYRFTARLKDPSGAVVAMASAKMQVRSVPGAALIFEASTANGAIVIDPVTGYMSVTLTPALTAPVASSARYDLKATTVGGDVKMLMGGRFIYRPTVTQ